MFVILYRELPSGSVKALGQVFEDKERAEYFARGTFDGAEVEVWITHVEDPRK